MVFDLIYCCMKNLAFFGSIDELKNHQLRWVKINQISKRM